MFRHRSDGILDTSDPILNIATNFADYQTRKYGKKYLTYLYNIK